jgi:hypothetical protein
MPPDQQRKPPFVGKGGEPLGEALRMPDSVRRETPSTNTDPISARLLEEWRALETRASEQREASLSTPLGSAERQEAAATQAEADTTGRKITERVVQLNEGRP